MTELSGLRQEKGARPDWPLTLPWESLTDQERAAITEADRAYFAQIDGVRLRARSRVAEQLAPDVPLVPAAPPSRVRAVPSKRPRRPNYTEVRKALSWRWADPCAYCGGVAGSWDHIDPKSRGGEHEASNLVRSCQPCNVEKGTRGLLLFLARRASRRAAGTWRPRLTSPHCVEKHQPMDSTETLELAARVIERSGADAAERALAADLRALLPSIFRDTYLLDRLERIWAASGEEEGSGPDGLRVYRRMIALGEIRGSEGVYPTVRQLIEGAGEPEPVHVPLALVQ